MQKRTMKPSNHTFQRVLTTMEANIVSSKAHSPIGFIIFLTIIMFCIMPQSVSGQTGTIAGEVNDAESGETLPGANVFIQGTTIGASTDIDGRYVLRRVPVGDHVVVFRYMGFETEEVEVTVLEDERINLNISLQVIAFMGDEISIVARQRGQSRALTKQRQSINIRNIISDQQIEAFGDNTVTGALSRISGMGHGGANIRGVGAGASNITMDGQRMGATGADRSVDLSTISADMVQELDVIKVITPDMDADALSGVINISTRRPIGGERDMNIRIGGGFQDRYQRFAGSEQRASVSYGDSPNERFTFGVNFSYQRDPNSREGFTVQWANPRSFQPVNSNDYTESQRALLPDHIFDDYEGDEIDGTRVHDYIQSLQNELNFDIRNRYGTGLQMTFQPSDRTTFHVQGMFNVQTRDISRYGLDFRPRVPNYQSPFHTGNPGRPGENQGDIRYNARLDESTTHQYTVQAGARHLLDNMDMEYSLGWGHGRFNVDEYRMGFQTSSRHEFILNLDDRWEPTIDIAPWSENTTLIPGFLRHAGDGGSIDHRINERINNDFKGSIDFNVPHSIGEVKFGSSASLAFMEGTGERLDRVYRSTLFLSNFDLVENASWNVFSRPHSTYQIPWILDLPKAKQFYINQTPNFVTDEEQWALSTETSTYSGGEHTFAGYVMGNARFGWYSILGGIRLEHTITSYVGREGAIGDTGRFLGATDIDSRNDYTNIFPNLQSVFHLGDMTNIRLAYSRSIGRPNFDQLNPYIMRNYASNTIQQGNPNLKPMLSNNYDLLFEHYFMNVGQISVGFFYKDMKDFVFSFTERIGEGDDDDPDAEFSGWMRSGFRNGEEATVYGMEFSWQQNYDFLPGFLGNFGTFFNYSFAQSIADLDRHEREEYVHGLARVLEFFGREVDDEDKYVTPLAGQRPHVINFGLEYNQGAFSSQLSYQWGAPSISNYGNLRILPPNLRPDTRTHVYFDQYNDAANDLSLTMRYRITSGFQVWLNASNILNHRTINYFYNRDYYPYTSSLRGRDISMGLRYQL